MSDDLVAFLRARCNEDEQIARSAGNRRWLVQDNTIELWPEREDDGFISWPTRGDARHAAHWDPARVLREIDAKRRIIDAHLSINACDLGSDCGTCYREDGINAGWPCPTLRLLALPYADHPDYREEWRP